VRIIN